MMSTADATVTEPITLDVAKAAGETGQADEFAAAGQEWLKQTSHSSTGSSSATTARSIEELSSTSFYTQQSSEIDTMASRVLDECSIKEVIEAVVAGGQFCVSIADPRAADVPLIAVSDQFEYMTGYGRDEVLGKNCRFLNMGCDIDFLDLVNLRLASKTGASYTGVLPNRRKSGELFLNLLDLRGLTVATNPATGEDLWFLVGIQADVTNLQSIDGCSSLLHEMHKVANGIRAQLDKELSALAVSAALVRESDQIISAEDMAMERCVSGWCLLTTPSWHPEVCAGVDTHAQDQGQSTGRLLRAGIDSWVLNSPAQDASHQKECGAAKSESLWKQRCTDQATLPVAALKAIAATGFAVALLGQLKHSRLSYALTS
mmetsp:Transcript_6519/g.15935  ORF Transcript_6519/g.15935 Transcript_6519/m.15935 type:complete len:375 (-) Transcript_6519:181-1305(-)